MLFYRIIAANFFIIPKRTSAISLIPIFLKILTWKT